MGSDEPVAEQVQPQPDVGGVRGRRVQVVDDDVQQRPADVADLVRAFEGGQDARRVVVVGCRAERGFGEPHVQDGAVDGVRRQAEAPGRGRLCHAPNLPSRSGAADCPGCPGHGDGRSGHVGCARGPTQWRHDRTGSSPGHRRPDCRTRRHRVRQRQRAGDHRRDRRGLSDLPWLELWRHANSLVARTSLGRDERVVIAGHVDTVPVNANLPARIEADTLHGLGSCDMKGGVAVALQLAATLDQPNRDVTYVFYEAEEVEAERNGLTLISQVREEVLRGDFAVVMEPSNAVIEAGCQGTIRVEVATTGTRAHARKVVERRQRDPRGAGDPRPAGGVRAAPARDRRPAVPRRAQRGRHRGRRGWQRRSRTRAR